MLHTWHEVKQAALALASIEPDEETGAAPPTESALANALRLIDKMDRACTGVPCRCESTAWRTVVLTWGSNSWKRIEIYDDGHFDVFRPGCVEGHQYVVGKVSDKHKPWQPPITTRGRRMSDGEIRVRLALHFRGQRETSVTKCCGCLSPTGIEQPFYVSEQVRRSEICDECGYRIASALEQAAPPQLEESKGK